MKAKEATQAKEVTNYAPIQDFFEETFKNAD